MSDTAGGVCCAWWPSSCYSVDVSFSPIVDRVRGEFLDMPGLELTEAQAIKLWRLDDDDCRYALDVLVDAGFLRWTTRRTVIRTGRPSTSDQQ